MSSRVEIPPAIREDVLRKCRRRCCVCYGLKGDMGVKDGQLAHLDQNPSNPSVENLAFLCLECHKAYDIKSNRVLGFTPGEVRQYRDLLYAALGHDKIEWRLIISASPNEYDEVKKAVDKAHALLRQCTRRVSRREGPVENHHE